MADLADVERAMVAVVTGALFAPAQAYQPGQYAASPVSDVTTTVYRGWPTQARLDADLAAGYAHVSVFPDPGMTRLTTRWALQWTQPQMVAPSITMAVSGQTVTLGGAVSARHVLGIQYGVGRLLTGHSYHLLPTDTLTTAAAALAALIPGATSSGPAITLPATCISPAAVVGVDQSSTLEVRRQTQGVRISAWCPTPAARDAVCGAVDAGFAGLLDANGNPTQFLSLADATTARVKYRSTYTFDAPGKAGVWRRDLCFTVEYGTTISQTQPEALFVVENYRTGAALIARAGVVDA